MIVPSLSALLARSVLFLGRGRNHTKQLCIFGPVFAAVLRDNSPQLRVLLNDGLVTSAVQLCLFMCCKLYIFY